MKNLGQKIERVDDATNEIIDKIRGYFWEQHGIDLEDYFPNFMATPNEAQRSADDEIYSIIHNKLKQIL